MRKHHQESIEKLKEYFLPMEGLIAIILGGSVAKGTAREDSDIDAFVVLTEEKYRELESHCRLAEVIYDHCTYEGGYFDIKYKTKAILEDAAERASEPTRNAYVKAQVLYSIDDEIADIIGRIGSYPELYHSQKLSCFNANLRLNRDYFMNCIEPENHYMRAHSAHEIVYSVYRLILAENRVLFPSNRRLEEAVRSCPRRPDNMIELGNAFLTDVSKENCDKFIDAFLENTALVLTKNVPINYSDYIRYYEEWWRYEDAPFPNEW